MRFLRRIFAALVLVVISSPADATTWYIKADGTGDAPTIQAGVSLANPGDVVLVAAGTYTASTAVTVDGVTKQVCVVIDRAIELKSESGAAVTTIGDGTKNIGIYVRDVTGAVVRGFSIRTMDLGGFFCIEPVMSATAGAPVSFSRGIQCSNAGATLEQNNFAMNGVAIELRDGSSVFVNQNRMASAAHGIGVYDSAAEIAGNTVSGCATGIICNGSAPNIHDNEISGGCSGVISEGSNPTMTHNNIHDLQVYAIQCGVGSATIEGNTITNTYGIRLVATAGALIAHGNILRNNVVGFDIEEAAAGTVYQNTIVGGFSGIRCNILSNPTIQRNIVTGQTRAFECFGSSFPLLECNDVYGVSTRYVGCPDPTGTNGNISADAQFCGIPGSDNFAIQSDSPCAPGHHPDGTDCGLIGAFGVGCGPVSTKAKSWGAIKAMYRH